YMSIVVSLGDQAVTSLYRKVVSPSVKFKIEELKKESHSRHIQYRGRSSLALRRLAASPTNSRTTSAPGRVESRSIVSKISYGFQDNGFEGHYDFHPTTHFKTTSLPAMPMTRKYTQSVNGTSRSVPLSVSRQSIIAHRVDKQYYLCGNRIPVQNRWDVDANDLLRLKLLAHHKQLAEYQVMKESQNELHDPRESPGGQMSTPTPSSGKDGELGVLPSGQENPHRSEGKWAEDTKSETSSVDDLDIIAMRGCKIRLPDSNNQQNTDTPDGSDSVDNKRLSNGNSNETAEEKNLEAENIDTNADTKAVKETSTSNTDKQDDTNKTDTVDKGKDKTIGKSSSSKSSKKVKNLRFQDDVITKNNQRRSKSGGKMEEKEKSAAKKDEQGDDHVNPYLDDWLGIKKKEVDGRYKPGKPPPNRIFISSDISKSKSAQVAKFSDMFLTEIIALQEKQTDTNPDTVTPETKFGIIGDKQKDAFNTMFDEIDKDKNGSVTLEELKLKMMPAVSRHDIKHFVQVFDLNKDQTVDGREFIAICCLNDRLAGTRTETADGSIALELEKLAQHIVIFKEMYKTMDEDDNNRLDVNEVLVMVSAAMGTEMGANLTDARRVLSAARDEFGYIDFVGFMSYIPFFAKLLRAIMQKPLSINDIEAARERVKQKELTFIPKQNTKKEPKSWETY
ncbi:hypothetical protein QZH41_017812, partial [Actinostola sp. cb2023]